MVESGLSNFRIALIKHSYVNYGKHEYAVALKASIENCDKSKSYPRKLITVRSRAAKEIFNYILKVLGKDGYLSNGTRRNTVVSFKLSEEVSPIVGGFLILLRRSKTPEKWLNANLLEEALYGSKYPGLDIIFKHAFIMSIELSRRYNSNCIINHRVADSVSTSLKKLLEHLWDIRIESVLATL